MPSSQHHLTSHPPQWRAVVGGVVATLVLVSLAGSLAAAATWGAVRLVTSLVP